MSTTQGQRAIDLTASQATLCGLANTYRAAWRSACKHDGIDPESKFVVFTPGNPFQKFVDIAYRQYAEAAAAYRAGGDIVTTLTPKVTVLIDEE